MAFKTKDSNMFEARYLSAHEQEYSSRVAIAATLASAAAAIAAAVALYPADHAAKAGQFAQALVGLGVCFSMLLGLLIVLGFGHELGPHDLQITMLMAFVPVPIYVLLVLWLDRMEKEPWYLLVLAFLYGATFAIFFASIPNDLTSKIGGESACADPFCTHCGGILQRTVHPGRLLVSPGRI